MTLWKTAAFAAADFILKLPICGYFDVTWRMRIVRNHVSKPGAQLYVT